MQYPLPKHMTAGQGPEILQHPMFKGPSVFTLIKELIRPKARAFDCLQVEVSSHCAAKCIYCPHTTMASIWKGTHMQAGTMANLWPLLTQSTRVHLQGWGEPFLHPHFWEYVAFARKADCLVSTTSCGLQLNEAFAQKIVHSGIDILAFSLAGTDADSNSVRQGAGFDTVCENIALLEAVRKKHLAVHLDVHIAYLLLADRMEAVLSLPKLMHELGVSTAIISTLDYVPHAGLAHLAIRQDDAATIQQARAILQEAQAQASTYGVQLYYALPSVTPSAACRENIQKSLYVNAQGHISPCVYVNLPTTQDAQHIESLNTHLNTCFNTQHGDTQTRAIFGNINEEYALDIWQKASFVKFRQSHAQKNPCLEYCQSCVKRFEVLD